MPNEIALDTPAAPAATPADAAAAAPAPMVSLADLASMDVSNVDEVRFEQLPPGIFGFQVEEAELKEVGADNNPILRVKCKVLACDGVTAEGVDPQSLVGKFHTESVFIGLKTPLEGIGRVRAFIKDAGGNNVGTLGAIIEGIKGLQFKGRIHERKKDGQTYTNIRFDGLPEAVVAV